MRACGCIFIIAWPDKLLLLTLHARDRFATTAYRRDAEV